MVVLQDLKNGNFYKMTTGPLDKLVILRTIFKIRKSREKAFIPTSHAISEECTHLETT